MQKGHLKLYVYIKQQTKKNNKKQKPDIQIKRKIILGREKYSSVQNNSLGFSKDNSEELDL